MQRHIGGGGGRDRNSGGNGKDGKDGGSDRDSGSDGKDGGSDSKDGGCKGNLTDLRRELHSSLAKGNPK
jgi:hypothetical protein